MLEVQTVRPNTATLAFNEFGIYTTSAIPTDTNSYILISPKDSANITLEDKGKYSIFDIANWFLLKSSMTHKKLQKMCYFAQAWCYALKGYRLANTDFQAWVHGPVSPVLWEKFKSFGFDPIAIEGKPLVPFENEDIKLLEDVWDTYGNSSGNELEVLSHRELPWIEARRGYAPEEKCSISISPDSMSRYYRSIYSGG